MIQIIILTLVVILTTFQLLYPPAFFRCLVIVNNLQAISNLIQWSSYSSIHALEYLTLRQIK